MKKNEKNCEKLLREMSFWQLVFGKCLLGFVHFGKKYICELSIWGNAFEVMTINRVVFILKHAVVKNVLYTISNLLVYYMSIFNELEISWEVLETFVRSLSPTPRNFSFFSIQIDWTNSKCEWKTQLYVLKFWNGNWACQIQKWRTNYWNQNDKIFVCILQGFCATTAAIWTVVFKIL